jgi:pyruvate kinase
MIRTKIVATMGPACGTVDALHSLFEAGVDVCRLNFSHGTLQQHAQTLANIREAAKKFGKPIAVLGDLCGPKIRVGKVKDVNGSGGMPIEVGQDLIIQREPIEGENGRISTILEKFVDDVQVGHRVLIEDGLLKFVCTGKNSRELTCRTTSGGIIKSSKGINLPNTSVNVPSITDADWDAADWAVDNDLDFLALSFVRKADDLKMLKWHLQRKRADIHLIAKIEKPEAVQEIDDILQVADGLMVARGDLGVEMDVAQVPIIQKDLIRRCRMAGKPVIVATQMLQSMIEHSSPTRAEVSDVANAIFDGTDAVMLSAETSVGKFPVGAVLTMNHVAQVTEDYLRTTADESRAPKVNAIEAATALARGAWRIVQDLRPKLVVIWSQTGETVRVFSKHHFPVPVIALSTNPKVLRRMALHYGVMSIHMGAPRDMNASIQQADAVVQERKLAAPGDRILVVAGWSPAMPGTMNGVIIHTIGEQWTVVRPSDAEHTPAFVEKN